MQVTLTQRATNRMEKHGRTVLKTQSQLRAVWWLLCHQTTYVPFKGTRPGKGLLQTIVSSH